MAGTPKAAARQSGAEETNAAPSQPAQRQQGIDRAAVVSIGNDAELKAQDSAQAVVVIVGSAMRLSSSGLTTGHEESFDRTAPKPPLPAFPQIKQPQTIPKSPINALPTRQPPVPYPLINRL